MAKPNFFIVGAPRCGTTALYEYLRAHPNIYMPRAKEPHYFSEDFPRFRFVHSLEQYLALFAASSEAHTAVGEASVWYAFSSVAAGKIREFHTDARIILMVRDPVDLIYSLHTHQLFNFDEDQKDFAVAWGLQGKRAQGQHIPRLCRDAAFLQYAKIGRLGEQLARILDFFPVEQVKVIVFEDFRDSAQAVYEDVLAFLGVPPDGRTEFPRVNEGGQHRLQWLGRMLRAPPGPVRWLVDGVKRVSGQVDLGLAKVLRQWNRKAAARRPLDPDLRREITAALADDIRTLARILDRDLSHWLV